MSLINLQHFTSIDRWKGFISKKAVYPNKPPGILQATGNLLIVSPASLKSLSAFTNDPDRGQLKSQLANKSTKEPLRSGLMTH